MVTPIKPDPDKTIYSPAEACGFIGLSWNTLRRLIREGDINATRVGRRYLITRADIEEFLSRDKNRMRMIARSLAK